MDPYFLYFIIGIGYVTANGAIRKLYGNDSFLPFVHLILWPPFLGTLIVTGIIKLIKYGLGKIKLASRGNN